MSIDGLILIAFFRSLMQFPKFYGLPKILRTSFLFVIIDLTIAIYIRSNIVLLTYFNIDINQIGQFTAAYRIFEGGVLLAGLPGLLVFKNYRLDERHTHERFRELSIMICSLLLVNTLLVLILWLFSREIIALIYTLKYQDISLYF